MFAHSSFSHSVILWYLQSAFSGPNLFNCSWALQLPGKNNEMQPDLSNTRATFNFCFAAKVRSNFPCCLQNERSKKKTNKLPKKTLYVSLVSFLEEWKCNFLQGETRDATNGCWLKMFSPSFLYSLSISLCLSFCFLLCESIPLLVIKLHLNFFYLSFFRFLWIVHCTLFVVPFPLALSFSPFFSPFYRIVSLLVCDSFTIQSIFPEALR